MVKVPGRAPASERIRSSLSSGTEKTASRGPSWARRSTGVPAVEHHAGFGVDAGDDAG